VARASAFVKHGIEMKTILIAAAPAAAAVISNVMGSLARMMTAHTLDEAVQAAAAGVDLIIAGTYFDNSRMFDLLNQLKSNVLTRDIPVLCVRGVSAPAVLGAQTSQPVLASFDVVASACKALGAVDFVDLCARQRDVGDEHANDELLDIVRLVLDPTHESAKPSLA
jgi:hypothetical protein